MNKFIILFATGLMISTVAHSQTQEPVRAPDHGLWVGVAVKKKFSKKFRLKMDVEARYDSNVTNLGYRYLELAGDYKIIKGLSISPFYRYAQKRKKDFTWGPRHRLGVDVEYEKKIKPFNFSIRERLYTQLKNGGGSSSDWRTKLGVEYLGINKKITPFASIEIFYPFNSKSTATFDKMRYQFGVSFDVTKASTIKVGYLHQKTYGYVDKNSALPTDYIDGVFSLGYSLSF